MSNWNPVEYTDVGQEDASGMTSETGNEYRACVSIPSHKQTARLWRGMNNNFNNLTTVSSDNKVTQIITKYADSYSLNVRISLQKSVERFRVRQSLR